MGLKLLRTLRFQDLIGYLSTRAAMSFRIIVPWFFITVFKKKKSMYPPTEVSNKENSINVIEILWSN
jgi:hypothetical protein